MGADNLLKIDQAIIVEGKYDKIKLSSIIDGIIITTNGYGIFKDKEKLELIRFYARNRGIIILTDSDSAGFKIRGYLKGSVPSDKITNVYIPDIFGKEKRKEKPSCEGKLGVEGIDKNIIIEAFKKSGVIFGSSHIPEKREPITRIDIYELGLAGSPDSSLLRKKLLHKLKLPEKLSTTGMLEIINTMISKSELEEVMEKLRKENW